MQGTFFVLKCWGFFSFQFVLRTWLSRLWSLKKLTLKTQSHLFLNVSLASHPGSGFLPSRFCWASYDQPCLNSLHSSLQATLQPSRIHPLTAWNTKSVCFSNPCTILITSTLLHQTVTSSVSPHIIFRGGRTGLCSKIFLGFSSASAERAFLLPHRFHAVLPQISHPGRYFQGGTFS